jgi:hypothetical protein
VTRRHAALDAKRLDAQWRRWAEISELCLGLRGSTLIGARRARSWRACVRAGLAEANRERERRTRA